MLRPGKSRAKQNLSDTSECLTDRDDEHTFFVHFFQNAQKVALGTERLVFAV